MKDLVTIELTSEKGGMKPSVRTQLKEQGIAHLGLNMEEMVTFSNGMLGLPLAKDLRTGDTIYLKLETSVGFEPKEKSKKVKTETEPIEIPNLFND